MAIEIRPNGSSTWTELDLETNGDESSLEINGITVYLPEEYIDDFSHGDVGSYYGIDDEGQADWPEATTDAAHRTEEYGLFIPENSPNSAVSLRDDHSEHSSSDQPEQVENYPDHSEGVTLEFYFRPVEWNDDSQIRFLFGPADYSQSDCMRLRITGPGYMRFEEVDAGSWDYYGDPDEDNWSWNDPTNLHRVVISFDRWPDVDAYIWDIDGGTSDFLGNISTSGGPGWSDDVGFGWWWNGDTSAEISGLKLIDPGDI